MSTGLYQLHMLIIQDEKGTHEIVLDNLEYTIGREPTCDIRLASQFVSRRHATLIKRFNDGGICYYQIVDGTSAGKPSANGLLINGQKQRVHDLQHEDHIVFGPNGSARYVELKQEWIPTAPIGELDISLLKFI